MTLKFTKLREEVNLMCDLYFLVILLQVNFLSFSGFYSLYKLYVTKYSNSITYAIYYHTIFKKIANKQYNFKLKVLIFAFFNSCLKCMLVVNSYE